MKNHFFSLKNSLIAIKICLPIFLLCFLSCPLFGILSGIKVFTNANNKQNVYLLSDICLPLLDLNAQDNARNQISGLINKIKSKPNSLLLIEKPSAQMDDEYDMLNLFASKAHVEKLNYRSLEIYNYVDTLYILAERLKKAVESSRFPFTSSTNLYIFECKLNDLLITKDAFNSVLSLIDETKKKINTIINRLNTACESNDACDNTLNKYKYTLQKLITVEDDCQELDKALVELFDRLSAESFKLFKFTNLENIIIALINFQQKWYQVLNSLDKTYLTSLCSNVSTFPENIAKDISTNLQLYFKGIDFPSVLDIFSLDILFTDETHSNIFIYSRLNHTSYISHILKSAGYKEVYQSAYLRQNIELSIKFLSQISNAQPDQKGKTEEQMLADLSSFSSTFVNEINKL